MKLFGFNCTYGEDFRYRGHGRFYMSWDLGQRRAKTLQWALLVCIGYSGDSLMMEKSTSNDVTIAKTTFKESFIDSIKFPLRKDIFNPLLACF